MEEYRMFTELLNLLYLIGGTVKEIGEGVADFLNMELYIPGYEGFKLYEFMLGLFIAVIVPYTVVKWANPFS